MRVLHTRTQREREREREHYISSNKMAVSLALLLLSLSSYAQQESLYQYAWLGQTSVVYPSMRHKNHSKIISQRIKCHLSLEGEAFANRPLKMVR